MAIKKTELYSSLWASCDELRGGMDASQYKDYVLTLLFVKYVSDKYGNDPYGIIKVPENGSFKDMLNLKGDKEIGDKINKIISKLAEENDLKSVIDVADFNDEDKLGKGKDMVDRLSNLLNIFDGLDLSSNKAEGDDLLGDAYEYLMRHFATESGKSKGQFYTPSEVSKILAKVIGITEETTQDKTVYDPTCGSGSLLLKVADESPKGLTIYGQENDNATSALARMNMILHNNPTAEIWKDNTLSAPHWKNPDGQLKTFDFAVANPPFSTKSWTNGINISDDEFKRFDLGVPPDKNGDYAFFLHIIKSLKSTGKGAVILPHGVLFRGNVESDIRKKLIKQCYIKGIIGLPANLFYGTGIPACIIVIDKEKSSDRKNIFMIDASKGFMKDGNKNRLRSQDIHKIVDVFNKEIEINGYSKLVSYEEIEKNEFNLNIPRYIDSSEPEDIHDLFGHLNGGIPKADIDNLDNYWKVFPNLKKDIFTPSKKEGYMDCLVESSQVKPTILNHSDFKLFSEKSLNIYLEWQKKHNDKLNNLEIGTNPKTIINELSEDLLNSFASAELLNKYDIYQILMDYWVEIMQDDVYIITQDGWKSGNTLRLILDEKNKKTKETPDLIINKNKYKADLIPPSIIISKFFEKEKEAIEKMQTDKEAITQELESIIEEHTGEEGLLSELEKVTKNTIATRLKELKGKNAIEEITLLNQCLKMIENASEEDKKIKLLQQALDEKVFLTYPKLTEEKIKELIIKEKWQTSIQNLIQAEIDRVTQQLANRVKLLEERYEIPLSKLNNDIVEFSSKVDEHLKKMGLTWV
ncbi:MAG: type I restriction-modification system subunit M [Cyanobacteriota bacterium]